LLAGSVVVAAAPERAAPVLGTHAERIQDLDAASARPDPAPAGSLMPDPAGRGRCRTGHPEGWDSADDDRPIL